MSPSGQSHQALLLFYLTQPPGEPWGQDLVYSFYTDDKTGDHLAFRLYEKGVYTDTWIELAQTIVTEIEEEIVVPAETYLFDSWYTVADLAESIVSRGKDWIGPFRSNRLAEFAGKNSVSTNSTSATSSPTGRSAVRPRL